MPICAPEVFPLEIRVILLTWYSPAWKSKEPWKNSGPHVHRILLHFRLPVLKKTGSSLTEILNYQVDGIPNFVFLNQEGNAIAQSVGEQPLSVFQDNLQALIASQPLPYASMQGNISTITPRNQIQIGNQDNPRAHGNL